MISLIKLKIMISLLGLFILLIGSSMATIHTILGQQAQQQVQSNTYNDPQGRFTMNYPSDWQLTTTNSPTLKQSFPSFISPNGMFFSVLIMPLPLQFNLDSTIYSTIALHGFMTGFQRHIHNSTVIQNIECNTYVILGKNACSTVIRGYDKNIPVSALVVGAVIDGNAYFFAAEGLSNTFYTNLPTVKQIVSSFQLSNQQPTSPLHPLNNTTTRTEVNNISNSYSFTKQWGYNGTGNGQFNNPFGIAISSSGNVYVTDGGGTNRIQKFDSSGNFITSWGSEGTGNGQFNGTSYVTTDSSGNVYVVDEYNNRIQKFDSSGNFITSWGSEGTGNGQFNNPVGITTDSSGNVYVVDEYNNRIQKFDSSGNFITSWGSEGTGNGQFKSAFGITTDSAGNVYVTDNFNNRIQKFDSSGNFITSWGNYGTGNGQFNETRGITTDSAGNVYVTDNFNNRIQKFDSSGNFITSWGNYGTGNGQFNGTNGIAIDTYGNVYVTDWGNNRVQVFSQSPNLINTTSSITSMTNYGNNGTMTSNTTSPIQNNYSVSPSQSSISNFSLNESTTTTNGNAIASSNNTSISELYNKVKDSVVSIDTTGDEINSHLTENGLPIITGSCDLSGSGFIYNQNGVIVTNWHVVSEQVNCQIRDIRVTFNDGNTYSVSLKGKDPFSDLAVLQLPLSAVEKERLNPLPVANSSDVFVGEEVAAVGNPEGLSGSITRGIISQIDRQGFDPLMHLFLRENLIQTDAAINPGNSGGPLLNMQGQVVGINEQGEPVKNDPLLNSLGVSLPGIGFDVPYSDINQIVPKLIQYGNYSHPSIGIGIDTALPSELQKLGDSEPNEANGVIVLSVFPNSPASDARINPSNDTYTNIIYQIDNTTIKNKSDMVNYIESKAPGDTVTLQSFDNEGRHTINIALKEKTELLKDSLQNSINSMNGVLLQSSNNQPIINKDKNQNMDYRHKLKLASLSGLPITKRSYSPLTDNSIPSIEYRSAINDNTTNGSSSALPIDTTNSNMTANYNNDTFGINTTYHSDWSVIDNFTSNNSSTNQDISQFISPDGSASITISKDNPGYNISDVKDYLISTMNNERSIYGNFTIINSDSCNVEDINSKTCSVELANVMQTPGYDLSFSYTDDNGTLWTKEKTGIVVGNSDVYYITLVAPSDQFSSYREVMDDTINNLTIDVTNTSYTEVQPSIIDEHPDRGGI